MNESVSLLLPLDFPIVGVGASAGGLEALSRLFSAIPADIGMAFLVVQHLAPEHDSMLSEIIGQKTGLAVILAADGQLIAKNTIHVIPPNVSMTVRRDHIVFTKRDDRLAFPMPIDDLLSSLAADQGSAAIGVILSGKGTDGANGMQSIKEEGGITLAQDDASADFKNMPQAAAQQSEMDFIGTPEEIAAQLLSFARHPLLNIGSLENQSRLLSADADSLRQVFELLHSICNVDFTHYKRGTVSRRLLRRMGLTNFERLSDYLAFLKGNTEEVERLYRDILIPVTCFFRDPDIFKGLQKLVFPALLAQLPPQAPLRIWVPGCSSGEEVYSIAICLLECFDTRTAEVKIQIFGTDLNENSLKLARRGIYTEDIERHVSKQRLNNFFSKTKGGYQIAKQVRDICIFSRHDVTSDPPFTQLSLISCRNLLIYLGLPLQKKVIPLFHYALLPGGYFMLGPSESIGKFPDLFRVMNEGKFRIFRKNSSTGQPFPKDGAVAEVKEKTLRKIPPTTTPGRLTELEKWKIEADYIVQSRYVPAGIICDYNLSVMEFRGDTAPYLLQPSTVASTNLQQLARPGLLVEIRRMLELVKETGISEYGRAAHVQTSHGTRSVDLEVLPVLPDNSEGESFFLIFFKEKPLRSGGLIKELHKGLQAFWNTVLRFMSAKSLKITKLSAELLANREQMRLIAHEYESTVDQLKASQDEFLSSNEEFQSINEELETAKEELQATNEELITTNDELNFRNVELNLLNQKLKFAGDYADTIIATMRDPLLVIDADLAVIRANAAFLNMSGLTAAQVENSNFYQLNDGQWDRAELRRLIGQVLPQSSTFHDYEIVSVFPGIGERTVLLSGKHLARGDQSLIMLSFEDVTVFKQDVHNLLEKVNLKDEFLAMLAHELRNPLEPIRAAMEIWRRGDAGKQEEKEAQEIMRRQIHKVVRLVDDLLDVARITRNSIMLERLPVDLVQSIRQAVEGTAYLYQAKHHALEVHLPDESVIVKGDAVRLEQIVANLMSNAAKYTPLGGEIHITLVREGEEAVVVVSDNGLGITADLLPRVFDLFVQAKEGLDRAHGGLGVGLSLVRRLVREHGGTIEGKSEGLHRGSTFTMRLPLLDIELIPRAVAEEVLLPLSHASRRILLVDDNVDSLRVSSMLLKLDGHEVQTAPDGLLALKVAGLFVPQIIILDIGLPGMDGFQLARRLRRLPQTGSALIVALSGYATDKDRELSQQAGFDHHFVKPVNFDKLQRLIACYDPAVHLANAGGA